MTHLRLTAVALVLLSPALCLAADPTCPPTPKWLYDVTRFAYTDLSNTAWSQDWPYKLLDDLAASDVQVFISRCHSGDTWQGLGWKSAYGELDPALRGSARDWEVVGGGVVDTDAHSGRRCLRLLHSPTRDWTYVNRRWVPDDGQQGAMLDRLKGEVSYWYKVPQAKDASLWLGVVAMTAVPRETPPRTGYTIPPEHYGDGAWHHVTIPYDYTGNPKVKWVHTSCFIRGAVAEVLLDDIEYLGAQPQPITNGSFEELTPDRDGTLEIVRLCHERKIRYVPYYWAQREPESVGREHPDWRCLNAAGKPTAYYCVNNPQYRELVRNRCTELVREVGADGVFFDMFHARADECYCASCQSRFLALTGQAPPLKEDFDSLLWQQWVDFKYRSIEKAMLDFNRAIKAANPEAVLLVNTWNAWVYRNSHNIRNSIRVAEVTDGLLEETGWYDVVDPSFFALPAHHNFMNWHLAGLCRDKRAFMWGAPSVPGWAPTPPAEVRARVMTMVTNGAVAAHSLPDRDTVKTYMGDLSQREPYLRNAHLAPWCGLVMSEKTELWYGRDNPKDRYVKGIYGAFQALTERHLPVSLVTDRDLELDRLEPHRVLLLPNCAALSPAECETLKRFVAAGGGLVATYATSLYDEHGRKRDTFGLAELLQAKPGEEFDNSVMHGGWNPLAVHAAYLQFPPQEPWTGDPIVRQTLTNRAVTQPQGTVNSQVPLHCRMLRVEALQPQQDRLRLLTAQSGPPGQPQIRTDDPGVIVSTYGKGKVIYFPADLTWSYFRYGHEYLGRLLELAVREAAAAPPPVEVQAPTIVQANTQCQGRRLIVHLLNDISSQGRSQTVAGESLYTRREVIPLHDVKVTFRDPALRRFVLVPGNTPLQTTATAEGKQVTIPRLDLQCMVVAE